MRKSVSVVIFLAFIFSLIPAGSAQQQQSPNLKSRMLRWRTDALAPLPAAQVGDEVFLQGTYIEVGIHRAGSFGTAQDAPAGFHPWPESYTGPYPGPLGFVADYGKDGWDVGTPPQTGDYFVPGSPEEGWSVEWGYGGEEHLFINHGLTGLEDIPMISSAETSSGGTLSAEWEGEAVNGWDPNQKLHISQTTYFDQDKMYFIIHVVLRNTGSVPLSSVEYLRNVDPDQEEPATGLYATQNCVRYQPGVGGNEDKALVVAKGATYGWTLGLGAMDSRAVVSTEGFYNLDPDDILDSPVAYDCASPNYADEAISLAFRFGTLDPGESVSFDYAYILNEDDLEEALAFLGSVTILEPTGTVSGWVSYRAQTNEPSSTTKVEFYVNDVLVGEDTTHDGSGVFETSFDSWNFPNGPATLKVIAYFTEGTPVTKFGSCEIANFCSPPEITFQPQDQTITYGERATLSVTARGTPPLRFQWYQGNRGDASRLIAGATSSSYTTPVLEDETNSFWARVMNDCGSEDSAAAVVRVEFPAYPALGFRVERLESNFIFFKEYINKLTWGSNPRNVKRIVKQLLYRKPKASADSAYELLAELGPDVFLYEDRGLGKDDLYTYKLVLVNEKGRESEPAVAGN